MGRTKKQKQLNAAGPSPKKSDQPSADSVASFREKSMESSASEESTMQQTLDETHNLRRESAPSPSPTPTVSAEPSSPTKRRLASGALPPSPKKSKSSSKDASMADQMTHLRMGSDETLSAEHSSDLSLDKVAISSVEHIEDAEMASNPHSIKHMKMNEDTGFGTQFEVIDKLQAKAEEDVKKQAEELIVKIFNAKFKAEHDEIDKLKEEVRQMSQDHNEKCVSLTAVQVGGSLENDTKTQDENNIKMKPAFSHAYALDKQWGREMLQYRKRDLIRVGRDGNDEIVKAQFSDEVYVNLAREIIHRFRPEEDMVSNCSASDSDIQPEQVSDFNLNFLSKLCGAPCLGDDEAFEAAAWFVSQSLLEDREETFRCVAAHPWYQTMAEFQSKIKQELVFFFDRRFTHQMGQLYGVDLPIDGTLLRLGCNFTFRQEDAIDCGGLDPMAIVQDNLEAWESLIEPFNPMKGTADTTMTDAVASKSSERFPETQEPEYNVALQSTLTPSSRLRPTAASFAPITVPIGATHRGFQVTPSELDEYKTISKKAFGAEFSVIDRAVSEGTSTPGNEATRFDIDVGANNEQSDGVTLLMDSEMMDTSAMQDVSLE